jgi:hypothetical protein
MQLRANSDPLLSQHRRVAASLVTAYFHPWLLLTFILGYCSLSSLDTAYFHPWILLTFILGYCSLSSLDTAYFQEHPGL